jgi:hypothetical protein
LGFLGRIFADGGFFFGVYDFLSAISVLFDSTQARQLRRSGEERQDAAATLVSVADS